MTNSKKRLYRVILFFPVLVYLVFTSALLLELIEAHKDYKANLKSIVRYCLDNK